jgi:hypothetical protein
MCVIGSTLAGNRVVCVRNCRLTLLAMGGIVSCAQKHTWTVHCTSHDKQHVDLAFTVQVCLTLRRFSYQTRSHQRHVSALACYPACRSIYRLVVHPAIHLLRTHRQHASAAQQLPWKATRTAANEAARADAPAAKPRLTSRRRARRCGRRARPLSAWRAALTLSTATPLTVGHSQCAARLEWNCPLAGPHLLVCSTQRTTQSVTQGDRQTGS